MWALDQHEFDTPVVKLCTLKKKKSKFLELMFIEHNENHVMCVLHFRNILKTVFSL